jgi:hypothetical protein
MTQRRRRVALISGIFLVLLGVGAVALVYARSSSKSVAVRVTAGVPTSASRQLTSSSMDGVSTSPATTETVTTEAQSQTLEPPKVTATPNGPHATALVRDLQTTPSFAPLTVVSAEDLTFPDGTVQSKVLFQGQTGGMIEARRFATTSPIDRSASGLGDNYQLPNGYQAATRSDAGGNQIMIMSPDGIILNLVASPSVSRQQGALVSESDLQSVASAFATNKTDF